MGDHPVFARDHPIFAKNGLRVRVATAHDGIYLTSNGCSNQLWRADRTWLSMSGRPPVSATSSAQSHGGARSADSRPPLLHPVSPDMNARADERPPAPPMTARLEIFNRQAAALTSKHPDGPPLLRDCVDRVQASQHQIAWWR